MIEIIQNGDDRVFYQKCRKCQTIFSYQKSDVVTHLVPKDKMMFPALIFTNTNEDGQCEISEIECPVCEHKSHPEYASEDDVY